MTNDEYIILLKKELLWGTTFMDQFNNQFEYFYDNKNFMDEIQKISERIGKNEFINIQETKNIIKDEIWNKRLPDKYKELRDIVNTVKNQGNAGTSAYISVYFSIRIMEMQLLKKYQK